MIGVANYIGTILPGIGSITLGGYWLVPFLNSWPIRRGLCSNRRSPPRPRIPKYRQLFTTDFCLPVDKYRRSTSPR